MSQDNLQIARAARPQSANRFNGAMLTAAREARFLSQRDLAEMINVSQPLIARWEVVEGTEPDCEQLKALADALEVRLDLFFVDRARRLASMSDFYHRALAKAPRKNIKAIHARCSILDIQIDRLLQVSDSELPKDVIPDFDPSEPGLTPEKIAALTRERMGIGLGPIPNLVVAIERCGGIVIDRDLKIEGVDALCRWVPELPKLFFVNNAKPADRIRHSLAHELGHTVMHFGRDFDHDVAEKQANEFASAFLMPANEIRRDFRTPYVTIADLAAIKRKWRVAMQSAARRAFTIGAIEKNRYQWLCVQISQNGWKKTEPISIAGETPTLLKRLLRQQLEKGFTRSDLAKLLLVREETIDRMLVDENSPTHEENGIRLRIVRD